MITAVAMALLSGIMSVVLFYMGLTRDSDKVLLWAVIFLGVSFGMFEWSLWLSGKDMFRLFFSFTFPLVSWFLAWFAFVIWLFEERGKRAYWVALLIVLAVLTLVAVNCMDCLHL